MLRWAAPRSVTRGNFALKHHPIGVVDVHAMQTFLPDAHRCPPIHRRIACAHEYGSSATFQAGRKMRENLLLSGDFKHRRLDSGEAVPPGVGKHGAPSGGVARGLLHRLAHA